jgi:uncharacterized membrane protein YeaQ/YmgE (transglycosylase-associated protein family)
MEASRAMHAQAAEGRFLDGGKWIGNQRGEESSMGIIAWIVLGGIAGWLAAAVTGRSQGCLMSILIGIVGAVIGGLVFNAIGGTGITGFNLWSLLVAFVGAIILLAIISAARKR